MVDERKMIYGFVQERLRELKDNLCESRVLAEFINANEDNKEKKN